ncbi:MAG: glycosyltransferase family 2 protein [Patescibacteria group bacterium]
MNSPKKVTINIVTWNSRVYLPFCLTSIFQQKYRNFSVLVIDNGSSDGTIEYIQKNFPEVKMLRNTQNLGYARAHNQGIKLTKSEFILIMNPDIILTPDYLNNIVLEADKQPDFSFFGGKILKFHFKPEDLREIEFTDKIDSIGLKPFKNRGFTNEGEGQTDQGQNEAIKEIFGVTGGIIFIKRNDLENLNLIGEYFDEDFFVYKEDIDLAWRAQLLGIKSLYIPSAVAYHHRQAQAPKSGQWREIIKSRQQKAKIINYYSFRNHLFLLIKNEFAFNIFINFPYIFWLELKKFVYLVIFEFKTLIVYKQIFQLLPRMLKKRKLVLKSKNISSKVINKWFV